MFFRSFPKLLTNKSKFHFSQITPIESFQTMNGALALKLKLPNLPKKIFFVSDQFKIHTLKELILFESPLSKVEINYSSVKNLEENIKLLDFLQENGFSGILNINIDNNIYSLKSFQQNLNNITVQNIYEELSNSTNSFYHWNAKLNENKINGSFSSTLAYFLKYFNRNLNKFKDEENISQKSLDIIIDKCLKEFSEPIQNQLEQLYEKKNELEDQIKIIESEKEGFEEEMKRRILFYQKLILLISLIQFFSFYYMIFHVDWLGWDIIEPITYTVSQITLLCAIRFFIKYGKKRDLETMQRVFMNKMINSVKQRKIFYSQINKNLLQKILNKDKIEMKIKLLKNKKNHDLIHQN